MLFNIAVGKTIYPGFYFTRWGTNYLSTFFKIMRTKQHFLYLVVEREGVWFKVEERRV